MSHSFDWIESSGDEYTVTHDGDFNGKIRIRFPVIGGRSSVTLPFDLLVEIVGRAVINRRIGVLEEMTPHEAVGLEVPK